MFSLLDGQTYTYTSTKDVYYHAKEEFVALAGETVPAVTPKTDDYVVADGIKLAYDGHYNEASTFPCSYSTIHDTTWTLSDTDTTTRLKVVTGIEGYAYRVDYSAQDTGAATSVILSQLNDTKTGEIGAQGNVVKLVRKSGQGNVATLVISEPEAEGITYFQDYIVRIERRLSLSAVSVLDGSTELLMTRTGTEQTGFDAKVESYDLAVPKGTESLDVAFRFQSPSDAADIVAGGYQVQVADTESADYEVPALVRRTVELDQSQDVNVIEVTVTHSDGTSIPRTYLLNVALMPRVTLTVNKTPASAVVTVIDNRTSKPVRAGTDGTYALVKGMSYTWTVAAPGYVSRTGTIVPTEDEQINVGLEGAEYNPSIKPDMEATWPYFRADGNNNSVIDRKTPRSSDEALLYWANRLGQGYDSGAAGCPILVDGYLYTYAGTKIYKLDTISGEKVAEGTMTARSSFAITPMTYAEGMVFIALSNGTIQAFNADTLESLWIYRSPNGGQPNCPITYADGKIYTGFWNFATVCDFVCLTVTDENPRKTDEAKSALWVHAHKGGYYWAGAYADENIVVVGSDSETIGAVLDTSLEDTDSGPLFLFDAKTGRLLDTLEDGYPGGVNVGNIRSTVVYDPDTNRYYYCGRGGYLCSVAVLEQGGSYVFDHDTAQAIRLKNGKDQGVSSTTTVTIHNGRAYVGADTGSYNAYNGQCVDVIDLATQSVAYVVGMGGRAQSTAVLTTAYVESEGCVYLYFFDNLSPGKMRVFKDSPGQTQAIGTVVETSGGTAYTVASTLFAPAGPQAQYCICSPVVDEYGIFYFKNDSAYMMAVGPTIEKIEVTQNPLRTSYGLGQTFDGTGMKVQATYTNGLTRDVTDYVTWPEEPFSEIGTKDVVITFPHTMYQNDTTNGNIGTAPDYNYPKPTTTVSVEVSRQVPPTVLTTELDDAMVQEEYSFALQAVGEPSTFTWSLAAGSTLPAGLSLSSQGVVSGTPEAGSGGAYTFDVVVSNGVEPDTTATLSLEIGEKPAITTTYAELAAAKAEVGVPYSFQLEATGYPIPVWSMDRALYDKLPAGLELNPITGEISGTPTAAGSVLFAVSAKNSHGSQTNKLFRLEVRSDPWPTIVTDSLDVGKVGSSYRSNLLAVGDPSTFEWSLAPGSSLPSGLSLQKINTMWAIAGTPAEAGTFPVTLRCSNGVDNEEGQPYAERSYELVVVESDMAPTITTDTLANGQLNAPYVQTLAATGYPIDHVWTLDSGLLPPGLSLDALTGQITGLPALSGAYTFTVKCSNRINPAATKRLTILIEQPPSITTSALLDATKGQSYRAMLAAKGVPATFSWALAEDSVLPQGLVLNESGEISGTPEEQGEFSFDVVCSNGIEPDARATLALVVKGGASIATESLPAYDIDEEYRVQLQATGYPDEFTWGVASGELPEGITLNAQTGIISGHYAGVDGGEFSFTISCTNGVGVSDYKDYTILVAIPPVVVSGVLDPGQIDEPYSVQLEAAGYPDEFSWALANNTSLPPGLELSEDGIISGAPTRDGEFTFQVSCSNDAGSTTANYRLSVLRAVLDYTDLDQALEEATAVREGVATSEQNGEDLEAGALYTTELQRSVLDTMAEVAQNVRNTALRQEQVDVAAEQLREAIEAFRDQIRMSEGPPIRDIALAQIGIDDVVYTGSPMRPTPTVTFEDAVLAVGSDYTVSYSNNTNAGEALVTIMGMGRYEGTASKAFTIAPASISSTNIAPFENIVFTGSPIEPVPTVRFNQRTLRVGSDYTVSYDNNINVGQGRLTVAGKGNFADQVTRTFNIVKASISGATVTAPDQTYDGTAKTPAVTVKVGDRTLVQGTDFTVAFKNNTNVGTVTATVTGTGNYKDTATGFFAIKKANVSGATVTVSPTSYTYNGSGRMPAVTVKMDGRTLVQGTDYTVAYKNNTKVGTATATITGKGSYEGTASKTFKIAAAPIGSATVTGIANKNYTGKAITQSPVVKLDGRTLKAGTDYTVTYKNNTKVGTATVTITGKGNYTGSLKKTFQISQVWVRLYGSNALKTMEKITGEFGTAKTAIVTTNATGSATIQPGFKDALASAALAGSYGAPMFTTSKGGLSAETRSELERMGVTTVYIVGSTNEVSANTERQIRALSKVVTVRRIAGATPSDRAIAAARQVLGRSDTVIIATQNNFKDALAVSSYAYASRSPILFAETDKKLSQTTVNYIKSAGFRKAIIVGGPVALPAAIEGQLASAGISSSNVSRLAGSNQYKTSRIIAEWTMGQLPNYSTASKGEFYQYASVKFQPSVTLSANKLGVACGGNIYNGVEIGWKDALAGAALCGKNRSVLLLMDDKNISNQSVVKANRAQISRGYVFGGPLAVGTKSWDALHAATAGDAATTTRPINALGALGGGSSQSAASTGAVQTQSPTAATTDRPLNSI